MLRLASWITVFVLGAQLQALAATTRERICQRIFPDLYQLPQAELLVSDFREMTDPPAVLPPFDLWRFLKGAKKLAEATKTEKLISGDPSNLEYHARWAQQVADLFAIGEFETRILPVQGIEENSSLVGYAVEIGPSGRPSWQSHLARSLATLPVSSKLVVRPKVKLPSAHWYTYGVANLVAEGQVEAGFAKHPSPLVATTLMPPEMPLEIESVLFSLQQLQRRHQAAETAWPLHQIAIPENQLDPELHGIFAPQKHGTEFVFCLEEIASQLHLALAIAAHRVQYGAGSRYPLEHARWAFDLSQAMSKVALAIYRTLNTYFVEPPHHRFIMTDPSARFAIMLVGPARVIVPVARDKFYGLFDIYECNRIVEWLTTYEQFFLKHPKMF